MVSKGQSPEAIQELYEQGQRDFGENRAQELSGKVGQLPSDIRWHFVGPLQTNKVRMVRPAVDLLHSLDRIDLVEPWVKGPGSPPPAIIQVKIGGEAQKHGVEPAGAGHLCERAIAAGIPALAGYRGPFVRLDGLTNLVFQAGDACLRIPGKGTEEYINRANDAVAAREAARAGVSPEVLHADPASGIMLTRYIEGAQTMSPAAFKLNAGAPGRAGSAFRTLHDSGAVFPFIFDLFAMIDGYLDEVGRALAGAPIAEEARGALADLAIAATARRT